MTKQRRDADPEALLLVLRAMGAGVEYFRDIPNALARRKDEIRKRKVEPVVVAWDGKLGGRKFEFGYHTVEVKGQETFLISAPTKAYDSPPQLRRGGATASGLARRARSASAIARSLKSGDGQTIQFLDQHHPSRGLDLSFALSGSRFAASALPSSAEEGRRIWGVFAPIYALHSKRNPSAGDLTDFEHLMDWMYELGGSVAATLPLLGAFLDQPFEPSPYSPATRLFWNEFYIDLARVPEFTGTIPPVPLTELVDYRRVMSHKRRILEKLAKKHFGGGSPERHDAFKKFIGENKDVDDYARFRAVTDRQGQGWNAWPARLREGRIAKTDYDENTKNYYLYSQWIVQEQLEALAKKAGARGQMLYLDLPLGLHADGYDVWRYRDFFVHGVEGGAPPDPVFTKGQNWGFPPMNPEGMRLNRYQYFIALLRNHFRFARLLRIDHVMGLYRLYWIPKELSADKGVYVEYPAEELYAILALESHRYRAGIVGENLGTVPPDVNRALSRHNIRGMYVAQYEIMSDPERPKLRPVSSNNVASLNTHDMPPFQAFLDGLDIDDRRDLGFLDEKTSKKERRQRLAMKRKLRSFVDATRFLARSMADIVLVNMEDLWQETLPQNVPTTNEVRPNWRRRMRPTIEQIRKMAGLAEVLTDVFAHRSRPLPL
jgi:4-alpha-glucanotransferase